MLQDELLALIKTLEARFVLELQQINATVQQSIDDQGQINAALQQSIDDQGQINNQQEISINQQAATISALQVNVTELTSSLPRKNSTSMTVRLFLKYTLLVCFVKSHVVFFVHCTRYHQLHLHRI